MKPVAEAYLKLILEFAEKTGFTCGHVESKHIIFHKNVNDNIKIRVTYDVIGNAPEISLKITDETIINKPVDKYKPLSVLPAVQIDINVLEHFMDVLNDAVIIATVLEETCKDPTFLGA